MYFSTTRDIKLSASLLFTVGQLIDIWSRLLRTSFFIWLLVHDFMRFTAVAPRSGQTFATDTMVAIFAKSTITDSAWLSADNANGFRHNMHMYFVSLWQTKQDILSFFKFSVNFGAIQKVCHRKNSDFWTPSPPCHRLSPFALTPLVTTQIVTNFMTQN